MFTVKRWYDRVVGLFLTGLFVAPVWGFLLRIIQVVSRGEEQRVPNLTLADNFMLGLQFIAVEIVYLVLPLVLLAPFAGEDSSGPIRVLEFLIGIVVLVPCFLLFWLAVLRLAVTEKFSSIFELDKNVALILDHKETVLLAAVQLVAGTVVLFFATILAFVTVVGGLVGLTNMFFYWGYISGHLARDLGLIWQPPATAMRLKSEFDD